MHLHIMWWLSYCRKIKFPHYQTSLGSYKNDFFEILIYLFAKYTRELLSNIIYQQYDEVNKEVNFIRGNLNTIQYINENLCKGRWQYINCTFDSFQIDNKFNRIIKYVANLLFNISANSDNKRYLREILFILDDVSDVQATAEECVGMQFNPVFSQFERVRDYCFLFLSNSISITYKNDLKLFAFLLPMEYVFEDFVFGFIENDLEQVSSKSQTTSKFLDEDANFLLRPDLLLNIKSKKIIADTKYKIIYSTESNPQRKISQVDIYQMLAYAIRFKVETIILFYPSTIKAFQNEEIEFVVKDEFANVPISIRAYQLPIINELILSKKYRHNENACLEDIFYDTKQTLTSKLTSILCI